jgi:hypothetical protein
MKRHITVAIAGILAVGLFQSLQAKEKKAKPGPLTGTWECTSHGGPQGDLPFTLYLEQEAETVTGSVSSPMGSTELSSATFKKKDLEIHIDSPDGEYLLTGKLTKKGEMSGQWSHEDLKGTWEGKLQPEKSQPATP